MSISLISEYSLWFIVFCIAGGFLYALFLYRKDTKLDEISKFVLGTMFSLRFLSVTVTSFLFLAPLFRATSVRIENPIIIFAQDNSESVKTNGFDFEKYKNNVENLKSELSGKYKFSSYSFGDKIEDTLSFDFSDKQTEFTIKGKIRFMKLRM